MRSHHDLRRPVITTGQAAKRLGLSRFHVARQVESRALPGYGIQGAERVRWYVYEDTVAQIEAGPIPLRAVPPPAGQAELAELLVKADETLHEIRKALGASQDHTYQAVGVAREALDEWSEESNDSQISLMRDELLKQVTASGARLVRVNEGLLELEAAIRQIRRHFVQVE